MGGCHSRLHISGNFCNAQVCMPLHVVAMKGETGSIHSFSPLQLFFPLNGLIEIVGLIALKIFEYRPLPQLSRREPGGTAMMLQRSPILHDGIIPNSQEITTDWPPHPQNLDHCSTYGVISYHSISAHPAATRSPQAPTEKSAPAAIQLLHPSEGEKALIIPHIIMLL